MEFLAKTSMRVKILTGWVVGLLRYQKAYKRPQRLTNANSLKSVDFLGNVMACDNNIVRRQNPWTATLAHTKNHSSHL